MTIKATATTVYFGGRRRYLSLDSACYAEARAVINKKFCYCEIWDMDHVTPPVTCQLHADELRYARLHTWMSARIKRAFLATQEAPNG